MDKKMVMGAVLLVLIVIAAVMIFSKAPPSTTPKTPISNGTQSPPVISSLGSNQTPPSAPPPKGSPPNMTGKLFSATSFASSASPINSTTLLAKNGGPGYFDFNLTTSEYKNGTLVYMLTFTDTGASYNVSVPKGSSLYYIDTNHADDSPSSDHYSGDDGFAVINSTGYISYIQFPVPNA